MRIGHVTVDPPVVLAPMAGITDLSFRRLCREQGAGLVCTGMISANAIHYSAVAAHRRRAATPAVAAGDRASEKTGGLLAFSADEGPISAQLFGADPEIVAEAAAEAERRGADLVDLNMGCAVPKVLRARSGVTLMAEPERAEAMIRAVVAAVRVPVTVKIRRGWHDRGEDAVAFARRCERAGAAAITVHPRWANQQFRGRAEWPVIAEVKQAVGIPVIGNGDLRSGADAARMMEETGCDAVMIGRAALGNPWIFREVAAALQGRPIPGPASLDERLAMAARHAKLVVSHHGEGAGVRQMRKHFAWYLKKIPGARALRDRANRATTLQQLLSVLDQARDEAAAHAAAGRTQ